MHSVSQQATGQIAIGTCCLCRTLSHSPHTLHEAAPCTPTPVLPIPQQALGCLNNYVTRRFEFQADAFGVAQGRAEDLKAALLVLDKENKSPPHTDPLYSAYHYSHPPLLERLRAIDAAVARGGSCAAEAKKKE